MHNTTVAEKNDARNLNTSANGPYPEGRADFLNEEIGGCKRVSKLAFKNGEKKTKPMEKDLT